MGEIGVHFEDCACEDYQEERKCEKKTKHISGGIDLTFSWVSWAQFSKE